MKRLMWWKGKQIGIKEWRKQVEKTAKEGTRENLLMCHQCCTPFVQIDKYTWRGDCDHVPKSMRIGQMGVG